MDSSGYVFQTIFKFLLINLLRGWEIIRVPRPKLMFIIFFIFIPNFYVLFFPKTPKFPPINPNVVPWATVRAPVALLVVVPRLAQFTEPLVGTPVGSPLDLGLPNLLAVFCVEMTIYFLNSIWTELGIIKNITPSSTIFQLTPLWNLSCSFVKSAILVVFVVLIIIYCCFYMMCSCFWHDLQYM